MPYRERENSNIRSEVDASQITINEKDDISYCTTPKCHVVMKIVKEQNIEKAFFRRLRHLRIILVQIV